jgi:uncharacterized protein (TIGR00369 family)
MMSPFRPAPSPILIIPAGAGAIPAKLICRGHRPAVPLRPPGRGGVRMSPTEAHMNMGGSIHGGAVMSFIDMAMFAGGRCAGMAEGHYVTLDLTTHFLARGKAGSPLDAHVELVRQTRGHVFVQGVCVQDGEPCYSFTGTLKRVATRNGPSR